MNKVPQYDTIRYAKRDTINYIYVHSEAEKSQLVLLHHQPNTKKQSKIKERAKKEML